MERPQGEEEEENHVGMVPEDVLGDVLRRVAPRDLAVARGVCTGWRAVVNAHGLLRPDLLPRTLGGVFVDYNMGRSEFFRAPPTTAVVISGDFSTFMPINPNHPVESHCGGLLLISVTASVSAVVNPATRQWANLPPRPPPPRIASYVEEYLAFDPAVSPCYEVFLMPVVARWAELDTSMAESEWPPAVCETHVFSSRTGRWEARSFVREGGEPAGTMADMTEACVLEKRHSVYSRGALYVHTQNGFFCRVSLANDTYRVIKPPVPLRQTTSSAPDRSSDLLQPYLGMSGNRVCCAILDQAQLRVWTLVDQEESSSSSSGHMRDRWVLKHQNNATGLLASRDLSRDQAWIMEDFGDSYDGTDDEEPYYEGFHAPYVGGAELDCGEIGYGDINFLGFHPFEEVLLFNCWSLGRGVAYDLNSSKVHDLGNMDYFQGHAAYIVSSFPYTPCWMENALPTTH